MNCTLLFGMEAIEGITMGTVKAKKAFELEHKGDHAIIHFEPSTRFETGLMQFSTRMLGSGPIDFRLRA